MKSTASSRRPISMAQRTPASPAERLSSAFLMRDSSFLSRGTASWQRPASASDAPLIAGLRAGCAVAPEARRIIGNATRRIFLKNIGQIGQIRQIGQNDIWNIFLYVL